MTAIYDISQCLEILKKRQICDQIVKDIENDNNAANVKPNDNENEIKHKIRNYLQTNGKLLPLKNEICKILLTSSSSSAGKISTDHLWKADIPEMSIPNEPLEIVGAARNEWDKRLRYQLRTLSVQQKRPLMQKQAANESSEEEEDDESSDVLSLRYIYTCEDLLETLANIQNPNGMSQQSMRWGLIKLDLQTPNLHDLRLKFKELHPRYKHLGVDDYIAFDHKFLKKRIKKGKELLASAYIPHLRDYAKFGIPSGLRAQFWDELIVEDSQQLNKEKEKEIYFNELLDAVDDIDMITDCLYRLDVDQTVDHPDFFPFDDYLNDILLAFSRDPSIVRMARANNVILNSAPLLNENEPLPIPPCHVIPFHQQTLLCAPLCFLHFEPASGYFLFRKLFCKIFCKLHIISSAANSILYLCKLFESLSSYLFPSLFFHCVNKIGVQPLTIVFPWMFTAFSSYLCNEEVLNIWDRILSYDGDGDGLLLLPIICCAIFGFRKDALMKCNNQANIHSVFQDLKTIKVIPLLQHFLFTARQN